MLCFAPRFAAGVLGPVIAVCSYIFYLFSWIRVSGDHFDNVVICKQTFKKCKGKLFHF